MEGQFTWTQAEKAQAIRTYLTTRKKACSSITELDLYNISLTQIPLALCVFINLQELDLSKNNIETFPLEIGNLTNLRYLLIPAFCFLEKSVNEFRIRLQIPQGCKIVTI